jgi:hypothetical protein
MLPLGGFYPVLEYAAKGAKPRTDNHELETFSWPSSCLSPTKSQTVSLRK